MKKIIPIVIWLISFITTHLNAQSGLSVTTSQLNVNCNGSNKGSITLDVQGGRAPYTYMWSNQAATQSISGLNAGLYAYTVTDNDNNSVSGEVQLMNCVLWTNETNAVVNGNVIQKTNGTGWGDCGAISINKLRSTEDGVLSYVVANAKIAMAFGLDVEDGSGTTDYTDISYAFLISEDGFFVTIKGKNTVDLGEVFDNDELKIVKTGNLLQFYRNNVLLLDQTLNNSYDYRAEIALFAGDEAIEGVTASFFRTPVSAEIVKGNVEEDRDSTGFISILPKDGREPYTFKWNNNSTSSMISNLPAGTYRGVVYDDWGDSVVIRETIGRKAKYGERKNVAITQQGLTKVDNTKLAHLGLDSYIRPGKVGWVEFKLNGVEGEFNALFREFDFVEGVPPAAPMTINEPETIALSGPDIPAQNSEAYNLLNITDASQYPTKIYVLKHKFTNGEIEAGPRPALTAEHGIVYKNGAIYILNNGSTLRKPIPVSEGSVIRIVKEEATFKVLLNGITIFSGSGSAIKNWAFDFNLMSPNVFFGGVLVSSMDYFPKGGPGTCLDYYKHWSGDVFYDGFGNIVGETRQYMDDLGRVRQMQYKDVTKDNVIAIQTINDAMGRPVLKTLPAPIFQNYLCYYDNFVNNELNTRPYNHTDFDVPNWTSNYYNITPGEKNDPRPVSYATKGSLGWYYSDNNTEEPYVPSSDRPYTRVEPDITNPSDILRASKAGDELGHGSGRETYQFTMKTAGELSYFLGFLNSWKITDMESHFTNYSACRSMSDVKTQPMTSFESNVIKKIKLDENWNEKITFFDASGNQVGQCLAGSVDGVNQEVQAVQDYINVSPDNLFQYVDVHLAEGCQSSLVLEQPSFPYSGTILYDVINLKTGRCDLYLFNSTNPNLPSGYYRIKVASLPSTYPSQVKVKYNTNYYNFTANYYDRANRLRIVVPPKGLNYAGAAFPANYTLSNGTVSKKFGQVSSAQTFGGSMPNMAIEPDWNLINGSSQNEMSVNVVNPSSWYNVHNFVVRFTGKTTSWSTTFAGEPPSPEAYRTMSGESAVSGNISKLRYPLDETDKPFELKTQAKVPTYMDPIDPYNSRSANMPVNPNLPQSFYSLSSSGTICSNTVMPVKITYQLFDQFNNPISGANLVTGYCTVTQCIGQTNSYSRTWSFPPANVHQLTNVAFTGSVAKLRILNLQLIHQTTVYAGIPWNTFTDITAELSVMSGRKVGTPAHNMTEVYEYDSWGQVTIAKKPDSGETDYIYSPDGKVRATQNSKQDIGGASNTDKFSYVNYDNYGRPVETGEYDRSLASGNPNLVFRNYREFAANSSAPSVMIQANNNAAIIDGGRKKDVVISYYDQPDPNFISQTGLNPLIFQQEHLVGKVSWTYSDHKWTWYSYDEMGNVKWTVNRYNGVEEAASPFVGVTIKTFYYEYDYLGNITAKHYQYHLGTSSVLDKMKQEYIYDMDKRLIKVQSTFYNQATPVTKTDAEYSYYLHGPLKRKQLADNLQSIDYVYTINGWLKNINSPELDTGHDPGGDGKALLGNTTHEDLFGMSLDYFKGDYVRSNSMIQSGAQSGSTSDRFNGHLMDQRWQSKSPSGSAFTYPNKQLMYRYEYDRKNQLVQADFGEITGDHVYTTANGGTSPSVGFKVDYMLLNTYDENGNITHLTRNASGSQGIFMDDLTYNYMPCSNKLNYAVDAVNQNLTGPDPYSAFGFPAGQQTGNFTYNTLGELATDAAGYKKYEYNAQGQILKVRDGANALLLEYAYDEDGRRIVKTSYAGTAVTKTLYVRDNDGGVVAVYTKPSTTNLFSVKEWNICDKGRIATAYYTGGKIVRVYEISDNLGNVRTTFKEGLKSNVATPFGPHMRTTDIKYFTDPNNSLVAFQPGNGYSEVYSPGKVNGIQSINIPVVMGDAMTASIKARYAGTSLPNGAALVIELLNSAGGLHSSVSAPVTSASQNNIMATINLNMTNSSLANGFFKVYVKNTSAIHVQFDDISLNFSQGGVRAPEQLDAISYYPQGSEMPGLTHHSSLGGRYGYQGQFAENDAEIGEQFFELRNYNPLLARFNTIDPYEQFHSPYLAMGNSHPNVVDPNGGIGLSSTQAAGIGFFAGAVTGAVAYGIAVHNGRDFDMRDAAIWTGVGAGIGLLSGRYGPEFGRIANSSKVGEGFSLGFRVDFTNLFKGLNLYSKFNPWIFRVKVGEWGYTSHWETTIYNSYRFSREGTALEFHYNLRSNQRIRYHSISVDKNEPDDVISQNIKAKLKLDRFGLHFWGYGTGGVTIYSEGRAVIEVQTLKRNRVWKPLKIQIWK